jgi:hypothetical protein
VPVAGHHTWNEAAGLPLASWHHHDTAQPAPPVPHDVLVKLDTQQLDSALTAFQYISKLWHSEWTPGRKSGVLYLADRNVLVTRPRRVLCLDENRSALFDS